MNPSDIQSLAECFEEFSGKGSPYVEWLQGNWFPLVLSGEIVGAVIAVKLGRYRRGFGWLLAALATIWLGGTV